jgi:hypothetical protein
LILDRAVLVKYFDMPTFNPTDEKTLDELMDAQVE